MAMKWRGIMHECFCFVEMAAEGGTAGAESPFKALMVEFRGIPPISQNREMGGAPAVCSFAGFFFG
ncbi:MAG: hypothetical protein ACLQLH_05220 [Terracidiphilus sp.]|jgi:hypothetical protein